MSQLQNEFLVEDYYGLVCKQKKLEPLNSLEVRVRTNLSSLVF